MLRLPCSLPWPFASVLTALLLGCAPQVPAAGPPAPGAQEASPPRRASGLGGTTARSGEAASTAREGIPCRSSESCIEQAIRDFGLGHYAEAATAARRGLATYPEKGDPDRRRAVAEMLDQCKTQIGTLKVAVTPADAEVRVNDRKLGEEVNREEVFVEAGEVRVAAAARGYESLSRTVKIEKGGTGEVAVAMKAAAASGPTATATATGAPSAVPTATATGGPSVPLLVTGIGLTAVTLGVGVGLLVGSAAKLDEGKQLRDELLKDPQAQTICDRPDYDPRCKISALDEASALRNVGLPVLIGGIVLGGATVAYVLITRRKSPPPIRAGVAIQPGSGAFFFGGNW